MHAYQRHFLDLALRQDALRFGEFTLKSGRLSPYFFNAGRFDSGAALAGLSESYAEALLASGVACDMLFGPAYKGIPLVATTAVALAARGVDLPLAYNRKEAKSHGEGGVVVGAPLAGRVLIIDDVITAGTAIRESLQLIADHGATAAGVLIALDRQERGQGALSAAQEVAAEFAIPVVAIASLDDLLAFTDGHAELAAFLPRLRAYRAEFGI